MQWITPKGSTCLELPVLERQADSAMQHWIIVAGGLALILSRVSPSELTNRFPTSHRLHDFLREGLRQRRGFSATPELLGEVMHEIADIADPMTKIALHSRFQDAVHRQKVSHSRPQAQLEVQASKPPRTSLLSSWSSRRHSTRAAEMEDMETQINSELLVERSTALRQSLASARNTSFADIR